MDDVQYKIKLYGTYARLSPLPSPEIEKNLQDELAYFPSTDLGTPFVMYQNGIAYRGVVQDLLKLLKREGIRPIEDTSYIQHRQPDKYKFHRDKVFPQNLTSVDKMAEAGFGVLVAPPGSGKTVCMAGITCAYGVKTAILVQQREVLKQALTSFKDFTDVGHVGVLGESKIDLRDVTVVTVQTLNAKLGVDEEITKWWESVECIIIDECHHGVADSYLKAVQTAKSCRYFHGVTATYRRDCELDYALKQILGPVVYEIPYAAQIEAGTIVPMTFFFDEIPAKDYGYVTAENARSKHHSQKLREMQKVYKDYIVQGSTGRNKKAVDFVKACREKNLTVACVVKTIDHAEVLHSMIPNSFIITGKTPTKSRDELFDRLTHREIDCVISTLFEEAVNVPSLDAVALLAGGKGSVKAEQRMRSTRACDKVLRTGRYVKTRGYVYYPIDHADYIRSHSTTLVAFYKGIASQHPENRIIYVGKANK